MTDYAPPALPLLHGEDFAHSPQDAYSKLRSTGPVAWAEIAPGVSAMVVTSHRAAVDLLKNTDTYSRDPHLWRDLMEGRVPQYSPVLALMAPRFTMIFTDGDEHARFRKAVRDCTARINNFELSDITRKHTATLARGLLHQGHADVVNDVALRAPLMVFAEILGCPQSMSNRLLNACMQMLDAGPEAAQGSIEFGTCLDDLVKLKHAKPGQDFTSWMISHENALTDEEIRDQLMVFVGAGNLPTAAWACHALKLLLQNDYYAGKLSSGTIAVRRAMQKSLWTQSPMANFCWHYARHDTTLHGVSIPAGVPVGVSHAAANTDPALDVDYDSDAHLAWSAGPHTCPARTPAALIAENIITTLLDHLPDIELAPEAADTPNRYGPFYQCPQQMTVRFTAKSAANSRR